MRWGVAARAAACGLGVLAASRTGDLLAPATASNEGAAPSSASGVSITGKPEPREVHVPLPTDKLACHRPREDLVGGFSLSSPLQGDRGQRGAAGMSERHPHAVLLLPGSFNPPTYMHLRLLELARDAMVQRGWDVLGAYVSPVNDQYGKKGLAPAEHRVRMCELATDSSSFIMVDSWEAQQPSYQRTLMVLKRIDGSLNHDLKPAREAGGEVEEAAEGIQVVLVCGADLLRSFTSPGVWKPEQVEAILGEHGVVCVSREGDSVRELLFSDDVLNRHQGSILIVDNPIRNDTSSSTVRKMWARGLSTKYLLPDSVIEYMTGNHLYK